MRIISLFLFTCLLSLSVQAQVSFGEASRFNDGWLFLLQDDSTAFSPQYDDAGWRRLDLPHDWSVEGHLSPSLASCTGYLPGGIASFRSGEGHQLLNPVRGSHIDEAG